MIHYGEMGIQRNRLDIQVESSMLSQKVSRRLKAVIHPGAAMTQRHRMLSTGNTSPTEPFD